MVAKKEQTPESMYLEFLEKALTAVENGEKNNVYLRQQIEKNTEAINIILQRLAVMDSVALMKEKQDSAVEKAQKTGWTWIEKVIAFFGFLIAQGLFIWYVITNMKK
jgi:hypothetical protein